MKKNLALAFLFAVLLSPLSAEAKDTKFNLGLFGAYHNNTFTTTNSTTGVTTETEDDAALGLGAGISAEFMMGSSMSFELGLAYIQRKSEVTGTVLGITVILESTVNVIEIPAIMHFYLGKAASIGVGAYAGLASNDASTAQTEFGATAALRFMLGSSFYLGGRYNLGLTDIIEAATLTTTTTVKSNGFYIMTGVRF